MQFVVCTLDLHCKMAIGNGNGQRLAAKNGCKDMIISNHLNNLLLASHPVRVRVRVRVHRGL